MRRLDVVVGPNGAGKSTFVTELLAPLLPASVFVNADVIARERWPEQAEAKSYEAARIASTVRSELISQGRSFIAETVFSHPSEIDPIAAAQTAGFVVVLHALILPEDVAVQRVQLRSRAGGHSVPERKIRERYQRLWPLVDVAIHQADEATIYDSNH